MADFVSWRAETDDSVADTGMLSWAVEGTDAWKWRTAQDDAKWSSQWYTMADYEVILTATENSDGYRWVYYRGECVRFYKRVCTWQEVED